MRVRWEHPDTARVKKAKPLTEAEEFAAVLRKHPGAWAIWKFDAANSLAAAINKGKQVAFRPAGAYEAKSRRSENSKAGRARVFVRYVGGGAVEPMGSPAAARHSYNQDVRTWARQNGWDVADRGRIPADLIIRYENAHPDADIA